MIRGTPLFNGYHTQALWHLENGTFITKVQNWTILFSVQGIVDLCSETILLGIYLHSLLRLVFSHKKWVIGSCWLIGSRWKCPPENISEQCLIFISYRTIGPLFWTETWVWLCVSHVKPGQSLLSHAMQFININTTAPWWCGPFRVMTFH